MLLELNRNLHGAAESPAGMTHKGMAYFAGTGPSGMTCGQCEHWKLIGEKARSEVCAKARSMGTFCSSKIPAGAKACKYFEYRPAAK